MSEEQKNNAPLIGEIHVEGEAPPQYYQAFLNAQKKSEDAAAQSEAAAGRAEAAAAKINVDQEYIETQVFAAGGAAEAAAGAANAAAESEQKTKDDADRAEGAAQRAESAANASAETSDIYFDIDYDGIISLKPEYRGDPQADAAYINAQNPASSAYKDCISDNGIGVEGSKIAELPETIVIPTNVNGEQVTGFAKGMFAHNRRIKKVVLPSHIKTVINGMFRDAFNLETVENTEQIEAVMGGAFQCTRVQELHFPNLTEMGGNAFHTCYFLRVIDIGKVTSIGNMAFYQCENLMEILGGENVTAVGKSSFYLTRRLKTLPFTAKLKSIGSAGFWASGCDLEAVPSDCDCATFATYKHYEGNNSADFTDYWSGATFTPCRNALNSLFHQKDPRWGNKQIGNFYKKESDGTVTTEPLTYSAGCAFVTLAEMYSAFESVSFNSPEEFVPIIEEAMAKANLTNLDPRWREDWVQLVRALGYEVVKVDNNDYITTMTTESLQAVYDGLADGALVYKSVMGKPDGTNDASIAQGGHVVLCYGINTKGEMLLSDTSMHCSDIGVYENHKSALPIYKHGSRHCDAVIVRKP